MNPFFATWGLIFVGMGVTFGGVAFGRWLERSNHECKDYRINIQMLTKEGHWADFVNHTAIQGVRMQQLTFEHWSEPFTGTFRYGVTEE